MSVKIMGMVWDLDIEPRKKLVLLAYADHANHEGRNIWPAVATIAKKTGYSKRNCQTITRELENDGYLVEDGEAPRGTNRWKIPIGGEKIAPLKSFQGEKLDNSLGEENDNSLDENFSPELNLNRQLIDTFMRALPFDYLSKKDCEMWIKDAEQVNGTITFTLHLPSEKENETRWRDIEPVEYFKDRYGKSFERTAIGMGVKVEFR